MSRCLYWGRAWCQTDIGHGCWTRAKVRPAWYWTIQRARLFLALAWRSGYADKWTWRGCIDVQTAWDVSEIAVGLTGPIPVHTCARNRAAQKSVT